MERGKKIKQINLINLRKGTIESRFVLTISVDRIPFLHDCFTTIYSFRFRCNFVITSKLIFNRFFHATHNSFWCFVYWAWLVPNDCIQHTKNLSFTFGFKKQKNSLSNTYNASSMWCNWIVFMNIIHCIFLFFFFACQVNKQKKLKTVFSGIDQFEW